ncbi:hypothetical protein [Lewinella sp. JB7]|uniref:hypothetical protein n=1 Tax=Lewinella sp. JB7 TaxID=2962887 RepID=UPI0020CA18F0|nr:hypothetical protein [Lewinella sp. JB7]MCP9234606.1 hypothetical protein [Lewinella sp. JB7]
MVLSAALWRSIVGVAHLGVVIVLAAGTGYAAWYLYTDYAELSATYLASGPFYRDAAWTTDFFTPSVKQAGDRFALCGLAAGLAGMLILYRSWRRCAVGTYRPLLFAFTRTDAWALGAIGLVQVAAWWYGQSLLPPSFDEAFSAVNAAGEGPFRSLTYYMLPNNHLLFNVLNAGFSGWTTDLVFTGRLLSLGAYLGVSVVQYFWLRDVLERHRWLAAAVVLLLALTLPVWGFAVQARGYALLLFGSWLAFVGAWYAQGGGRGRWSWLFSGGCVVAYAAVPVFLYAHLALLAWILTGWIGRRRVDGTLLAPQLVAGVAVLLFYLPAISFSGLSAITANRYVAAATEGYAEFAVRFLPTLPDYANYATQALAAWSVWLMPALYVLPVIVWWRSSSATYRRLARFQLLLLVATVGVVLLMRAVPFHRSLIFQLHFGILIVVLFLQRLPALPVAVGATGFAALYLAAKTPTYFSLHLYYYDIVPTHTAVARMLATVPDGAAVYATDEGFYARYLLQQREVRLVDEAGTADFYVRDVRETSPPAAFRRVGEAADIELFQREEAPE